MLMLLAQDHSGKGHMLEENRLIGRRNRGPWMTSSSRALSLTLGHSSLQCLVRDVSTSSISIMVSDLLFSSFVCFNEYRNSYNNGKCKYYLLSAYHEADTCSYYQFNTHNGPMKYYNEVDMETKTRGDQ